MAAVVWAGSKKTACRGPASSKERSSRQSIPAPHFCWYRTRVVSATKPTSLSRDSGDSIVHGPSDLICSLSVVSMIGRPELHGQLAMLEVGSLHSSHHR